MSSPVALEATTTHTAATIYRPKRSSREPVLPRPQSSLKAPMRNPPILNRPRAYSMTTLALHHSQAGETWLHSASRLSAATPSGTKPVRIVIANPYNFPTLSFLLAYSPLTLSVGPVFPCIEACRISDHFELFFSRVGSIRHSSSLTMPRSVWITSPRLALCSHWYGYCYFYY